MLDIPNLPAPGFDQPLELLRACHMKMLMNCRTLEKLAGHIHRENIDQTARDTAATIRRYFNEAAPLHHQDEEQDLFPLLLTISACLKGVICQLNQEHTTLEESWAVLDELLAKPESINDSEAFTELCGAFAQAYRDHIAVEEENILLPIEGQLTEPQLERLGRAMAARRGAQTGST